jgi:16S rRNA (uracil1498-N3)-methyltransferase
MAARFFVPVPFATGAVVSLPATAARHVQVLRLQPGGAVILFNDDDGADWSAEIVRIGRRDVEVRLGVPAAVDRELAWHVTVAVAVPANDRMDALVEKAGELGAAVIQPLVSERSVVRLAGERAAARQAHWRAVAAAASEQCGRARVAAVLPTTPVAAWLDGPALPARRFVLSLAAAALAPDSACREALATPPHRHHAASSIIVLSGPEGGLTPDEEAAALGRGFVPISLGPRILRADTAPLAFLAWLALGAGVAARGR